MGKGFFSFPNPVNHTAARVVAAGVVTLTAVALGTQALWLTIPLAYGFVARVLAGPRLSPLGFFATRVAPAISRVPRLVPGPPKRFAQAMGAAFTLAAMGCWLAGLDLGAEVLLALLLVPATLEAGFGYCVGCEIFGLLMRAGLIPQSICEECADIYSAAARRRRAATASRP